MLSLSLLAGVALASQASAACSRAMLEEATAAYIKAQTDGLPNMAALTAGATYAENDTPMEIQKGVLSQSIPIDFSRSLHDTTECATFTEISSSTGKHPYVIHTRMLFTDDKISSIQSVVSDDGDWLFNATKHLKWNSQENWGVIPAAKRDAREVIKAAGDAYLDSWGDGTVVVPYGTPCARLEGGEYTGASKPMINTCTMPLFPLPFKITNRRYVIDEDVGGLDIFNDFPFIDTTQPNGTSSTNFMRVEGGMLRYIHEVTVCATKNCGR
ncbi:hypothetical protein BJ875DRAFT_419861 [Amylocarpus encephaloides]|uniref:DUF8021 domain-containing protein n=1 Tax=Amylocarpus encephaloides TaxID=45428 RepID=A0A9P8C7S5_9HELO|nr:hypothetical protein BJ875DRAFT_419861 [Amylocarpus encephaloides]